MSQTQGLFHIAIKTADVAASDRFYIDIIGLTKVFRPNFPFPGSWLATEEGAQAIIHTYAGKPAHVDGKIPFGTAAIDHVALLCHGWDGFLDRVKASGQDWRAQVIPGINVWQIYIHDPSGTMFELTFMGDSEERPVPDIPSDRQYVAEERWGPFAKAAEPA